MRPGTACCHVEEPLSSPPSRGDPQGYQTNGGYMQLGRYGPHRDSDFPPEHFAADAGSAGVGRFGLDQNVRPIEIIMACAAGRISIGEWS
jgi:hypothetical protein